MSCERCGWTDSTWGFVVDTAPKGFPRSQTKRGGFETEKDAGAAMVELLRNRREGDRTDLTTGQFLTGWLRDAASGGSIRRTTAKAYDVAIRVHIVPRLGRVPLRQLSRPLIRDLYEFLRLRGRARGSAGGLAPKTIHNVHLTLHRALQDAVADGFIASNPAARRLVQQSGKVTFHVVDDGRGFDPVARIRGSGLTYMADRLDALGGSLDVQSTLGQGTRLIGAVPVIAQ
jgi:hypothetical protein